MHLDYSCKIMLSEYYCIRYEIGNVIVFIHIISLNRSLNSIVFPNFYYLPVHRDRTLIVYVNTEY